MAGFVAVVAGIIFGWAVLFAALVILATTQADGSLSSSPECVDLCIVAAGTHCFELGCMGLGSFMCAAQGYGVC